MLCETILLNIEKVLKRLETERLNHARVLLVCTRESVRDK